MATKREFRIFERDTGRLEHTVDVTGKCPRMRDRVEEGLYRKVDFERFYLEEWIGGHSINKAKGSILDMLDGDPNSEFVPVQMALATGYSESWCRATATVLARHGEIREHERHDGRTWSLG